MNRSVVSCFVSTIFCLGVLTCSTLDDPGTQTEKRSDVVKASVTDDVERGKVSSNLSENPCETVLTADEQRLYHLLMDFRTG